MALENLNERISLNGTVGTISNSNSSYCLTQFPNRYTTNGKIPYYGSYNSSWAQFPNTQIPSGTNLTPANWYITESVAGTPINAYLQLWQFFINSTVPVQVPTFSANNVIMSYESLWESTNILWVASSTVRHAHLEQISAWKSISRVQAFFNILWRRNGTIAQFMCTYSLTFLYRLLHTDWTFTNLVSVPILSNSAIPTTTGSYQAMATVAMDTSFAPVTTQEGDRVVIDITSSINITLKTLTTALFLPRLLHAPIWTGGPSWLITVS